MKEIAIDCRGFVPRSGLHKAFADALSFPDHYGNNLDALHDCLTAICEETHIQLLYWQEVQAQQEGFCNILRQLLNMSCSENPRLHIEYC